MIFIDTDDGFINSNCIVRYREIKVSDDKSKSVDERWRTRLYYTEGDETRSTYAAIGVDVAEEVMTVIAAHPGYFVIDICSDEPHEVYTIGIVGWRVERGRTMPVCADEFPEGYAILSPGGCVWRPYVDHYSTVEQFRLARIEEMRKQFSVGHVTE